MKTADELCHAFRQATTAEEITLLGQELKANAGQYTTLELADIIHAANGITDNTALESENDGWGC